VGPDLTTTSVAWRSLRQRAVWFGPEDRPLLGWLTQPASGPGETGVVVVPPLGYEYWTTHRALRALSERLAAQGCSVLRFDLDGTGDSAGGPADPDRLGAWQRSVEAAATFLRGSGSTSLVVAGVRFGATLALLEGAAVGADRIVAWAPVEKGRPFVRELRLLGQPIPDDVEGSGGGIVHAGSAFGPETLDELRVVDVARLSDRPAPRVLVVDRDDRPPSEALLERLRSLGASADHAVVPGSAVALDRPTEYSDVPDLVVQTVSDWVGRSAPARSAVAPAQSGADTGRIGPLTERAVQLGHERLVGILTEAVGTRRATIVWCNSGSEPHVGPGRAWVEYARALATAGYASVRLDFSGWGESPDLGHAPGRPYDAHCVDEIAAVVDDLRAKGHERVVVAGLCAGAWVALRSAVTHRLDGVIAINPQLYWQPGDPVEADIVSETRVRRTEEIRHFKRGRRAGVWSALDVIGVRHPAADWLRAIDASDTPVLALFAEGDDGLEFLEDRVGRTWSRTLRRGAVTCRVVAGIDHPMHRTWMRRIVIDEVRQWLDGSVDVSGGSGASGATSVSDLSGVSITADR
jgi:alpha-beta hydrolase superfamily lysophospholipase